MARNVYGLDLGTYEIKVYEKKTDDIRKDKSVIAMKGQKYIFAAGDEAFEMCEKAPADIQVVFPMQNGVIARFDDMQYLLEYLLKKEKHFSGGAEYLIAVPTDVTEVEKRAFYDLVNHSSAKAKSVRIVERGIADAIGAGVPVFDTGGTMIVNMGGSTTELSVIASGGIVLNRLFKLGGDQLDQAIIERVRRNKDFLIGRQTAERLRTSFSIFYKNGKPEIKVTGRNLITGVPDYIQIPVSLVRAAVKAPLDECVGIICSMIDRTPPDVHREIEKNGIYMTGGLTKLRGIERYIEARTGFRVTKAAHPELCSVIGLREIIRNKKEYKQLTYSMLDEDYRWLR